jgi:hypothetical protein
MSPRRLAAALLATTACACAVPRSSPRDAATDGERAAALAQDQRADDLERALSALSLEDKPPDCARACELVGQICDLSQRICLISGRHEGDADLATRCAAAEQRCRRSRDRVPPSCSCQPR